MYWYSDDRSIQFNFSRQKSAQDRAFHGHGFSPVFLTNILKYRLDRHLTWVHQSVPSAIFPLFYFLVVRNVKIFET